MSTETETAREHNLRIAHDGLVTAKYALHALSADTTIDAETKEIHRTAALRTEGLIDWVHGQRFGVETVLIEEAS